MIPHIATIENGQPGDSLDTEAATAHLFTAAPLLYEALRAQEEADRLMDAHTELLDRACTEGWDDDPTGRSHLASALTRAVNARDRAVNLRAAALASDQTAPSTEEVKGE